MNHDSPEPDAAAHWEIVQALFHDLADLPEGEKQRALEVACAGNPALQREVGALLAADTASPTVLDRDLASISIDVIGGASPLPTGRFGPYRITRLLGEGGMGVVYLGQRDDLDSLAAIKILRDAWLSPARRERFASEQRTLAQLNHPAIARLYDADTLEDGTPWFVMEYVPGLSLTDYCLANTTTVAGRLRLFRDVCEAVQHAHRHAVIHRDLKPSNIMVTVDGKIKLLDFGIAKQLESLEVTADQTRSNVRMMTPAYAAPEQVLGERIGVHTDVYSLGVVLYELLTTRLPFDLNHRSPSEADALIVAQDAERPSLAVRRLSAPPRHVAEVKQSAWADLDVLCLTAMQKNPLRRYPSVDALIRDVDHYLAGEPLEARPDTLWYRTTKFTKRHSLAVTVAALVTLLIASLAIVDGLRLTRARNSAVTEAARAKRIESFMLSLFQGNDPSAGPADSLRVITLLDRGVQEAQTLSADPLVQADLYLTLGGIFQKLGAFDRADTAIAKGVTERQRVLGTEHPDVAAALVTQSLLRIDQAKYEEGEALARQALAIISKKPQPEDPVFAQANLALGRALEERGEYASAVPFLKAAIQVEETRAAGTPTSELAEAVEELANTHFQAGDYDLSDSLNHQLLDMNRTLHGDQHPAVADILINLGAIQFQRGNYVEAERFDREALKIDKQWYGPDHYETASAMTLVGRALVYQKRFPEAVTILRQSLAIQERVNGPMHPRVASALNDLGLAATKGGELDEAEADFRRMDAIYQKVYGDHHYLIAIARSNLATVFVERKEYAKAEAMYRDVVARFTSTQGPNHMNTAIARIKLGRAILRQGRLREAEVESAAGYALLKTLTAANASWLQSARTDLAAIYDSLKEPEKAAKIRHEMADTGSKAIAPAKGN